MEINEGKMITFTNIRIKQIEQKVKSSVEQHRIKHLFEVIY